METKGKEVDTGWPAEMAVFAEHLPWGRLGLQPQGEPLESQGLLMGTPSTWKVRVLSATGASGERLLGPKLGRALQNFGVGVGAGSCGVGGDRVGRGKAEMGEDKQWEGLTVKPQNPTRHPLQPRPRDGHRPWVSPGREESRKSHVCFY